LKQIESLDLISTPVNRCAKDDTFDPLHNVTKEDMAGAIALAAELEPETYGIDHKFQITSGPNDDPEYLRAVMLLISCKLRAIDLTSLQERNLQRLQQQKYQQPNSVLDAWMLLRGKYRRQFGLSKLIDRYPGLRKDIPQECLDTVHNDECNGEERVDDEDDEEEEFEEDKQDGYERFNSN